MFAIFSENFLMEQNLKILLEAAETENFARNSKKICW
jgi:hypothetical protein